MPQDSQTDSTWYAVEVDEVFQAFASASDGLSEAEARQRLDEHGPNRLHNQEKESALSRFPRQLQNILIYILVAAAVISGVLGELMDMGVILAVVLIIAIIGFIQEGKAEQALESIRQLLALEAKVRREGKE
jgi:magnesium-transporting ATPase (P-type)